MIDFFPEMQYNGFTVPPGAVLGCSFLLPMAASVLFFYIVLKLGNPSPYRLRSADLLLLRIGFKYLVAFFIKANVDWPSFWIVRRASCLWGHLTTSLLYPIIIGLQKSIPFLGEF